MTKPILPFLTPAKVVETALDTVEKERSGEQLGLYCGYNSIDISMGKYWRFNNVNLLGGLSGHGKSYMLNSLTENFLDNAALNEDFYFTPIVLHFCFEMSATNEVLRSCASDLGISYSRLLSSEYDKETGTYNKLTDEELVKVKQYLEYYKKKNIIFIENSGNVRLIYNTVEYFYLKYNSQFLTRDLPVKYMFVVNVDHTLLIDTLDEKSSLELMANVGKLAITLRKEFYCMVNLLGQLNNNIEDSKRLLTPSLHYPQKSDIYAQSQLYNACDNVYVIHQPQLLKISAYGKNKIDTKGLIHLIKLKSRHGKVGSIWLYDNLSKGKIVEYPKNESQNELQENNDETIQNI